MKYDAQIFFLKPINMIIAYNVTYLAFFGVYNEIHYRTSKDTLLVFFCF